MKAKREYNEKPLYTGSKEGKERITCVIHILLSLDCIVVIFSQSIIKISQNISKCKSTVCLMFGCDLKLLCHLSFALSFRSKMASASSFVGFFCFLFFLQSGGGAAEAPVVLWMRAAKEAGP